jgi:CheY-like chemotaxis protein
MGRRILVADDSSTIQKVIKIAFSRLKIDIVEASSFLESISALSARSGTDKMPDMIIVDASLPGARSPADFRRLSDDCNGAPVLLLIGSYEAVNEDDFRAAGFTNFLKKPFESSDIVAVAEQLLDDHLNVSAAPKVAAPEAAAPRFEAPSNQSVFDKVSMEHTDSGFGMPGPVTPPPPGKAFRETMFIAPGGVVPQSPRQTQPPMEEPRFVLKDTNSDLPQALNTDAEGSESREERQAREERQDREESEFQDAAANASGSWPVPPPPPPMTDESRKGRKAFDATKAPPQVVKAQSSTTNRGPAVTQAFNLNSPKLPESSSSKSSRAPETALNRGGKPASEASLSEQLLPLLEEMLPALVRQAVEDYCNRHFKTLAREIIAGELRRLADEKARHLVDN